MSDPDDLQALRQAVLSVQDMREALHQRREGRVAETGVTTERIATTEARLEGFYWVILGQNPPEIAYWERGEWWLAGDPNPWQPEAGPWPATGWCSSRDWRRWLEHGHGQLLNLALVDRVADGGGALVEPLACHRRSATEMSMADIDTEAAG